MKHYTFEHYDKHFQVMDMLYSDYQKYEKGFVDSHLWKETYFLLKLNIFNEKIAHFLNYVLNYERYQLQIHEDYNGGIILLNNYTRIKITPFNEVAIKLLIKNPKGYQNICIFKPTIYRSLRKMLLNFKKEKNISDNVYEISDNGHKLKISRTEFDILYAYFGSNNENLQKFSKEELDNVFGQKFENQFLRSAFDSIGLEMDKLKKEHEEKIINIKTKWKAKKDELLKMWCDEEDQENFAFQDKIDKLNNQISLLKCQNEFTF